MKCTCGAIKSNAIAHSEWCDLLHPAEPEKPITYDPDGSYYVFKDGKVVKRHELDYYPVPDKWVKQHQEALDEEIPDFVNNFPFPY